MLNYVELYLFRENTFLENLEVERQLRNSSGPGKVRKFCFMNFLPDVVHVKFFPSDSAIYYERLNELPGENRSQ